jgi:hypothetical protein
MPASTTVKNWRDGSLIVEDGTGTPIDVTVKFENGDFSISGLSDSLHEVVAYQSRGELSSIRRTARTFPTFSFTAQMSEFTSATDNSLADAIMKNGAFASAVSTLGASADVYTVKLTFRVEGTNFGDSADHSFTLDDCKCTIDFAEGDPNTFSVSGTVYGAIGGDLAI